MLLIPYIRFLSLALLATVVPLVDAKGGGKAGAGKSKGSSKGKGGGNITKTTIIVGGKSQEQCKDSTNQIVPCPKNNKATIIAVAVVCSVVGLVLILLVIYFIVKRRNRNKRELATKVAEVPAMGASQKKEYKPLVDADEKHRESV